MDVAEYFQWQGQARLFAGEAEIVRPPAQTPDKHLISAEPLRQAAQALGQALSAGAGFCLHGTSAPQIAPPKPGMFYTLSGGTSGIPKVILRSQASWIASFHENAKRFSLNSSDKAAVFGGLDHSLSLYGVVEALHLGLDAHVLAKLGPKAQRRMIRDHAITVLYVTPTQLRLLAASSEGTLPSVRLILSGGGDLDGTTIRRAKTLCPNAEIVVFYGAAETSFVTLSDAQTPDGSVGRAYPGVQIEVRNAQGAQVSGIGEIWVKSPYLFDSYAAGESPLTRWQDGALSVGELGRLDADGNLWITGRMDRAVNIADTLISPEVIERELAAALPQRACAVIPVPDPLRGQRLITVLEGADNADLSKTAQDAAIRAVGRNAAPRRVLFHPALPRLSSGKTDLATLTQWAKAQLCPS